MSVTNLKTGVVAKMSDQLEMMEEGAKQIAKRDTIKDRQKLKEKARSNGGNESGGSR